MSRLRRLTAFLAARSAAFVARLRRAERRELSEFRRWLENTSNLLHLSILVFVPLLIGVVTFLSRRISPSLYLLFPPLASGTYTLFSDPEGRFANPVRFVASLTVGALCGLVALRATGALAIASQTGGPTAASAALAVFLTGAVTWAADVEAPSAFSTALLTLVFDLTDDPVAYVVSVFLASSIVAGAFVVWREEVYEQRAQYLYETVSADDHVLVPMRGEHAARTALFGARLAAAHEAGKVVLLGILPPGTGETDREDDGPDGGRGDDDREDESRGDDDGRNDGRGDDDREDERVSDRGVDESRAEEGRSPAAAETIERLESHAAELRSRVGVPCEVVVAAGDPVATTVRAARNANCDLVVTPYEEDRGLLSSFVRGVFRSPIDAVAFRSVRESRRWERVLVLVSRPGDTAHAMVDFAGRLVGGGGVVSLTTCIGRELERRPAETRLANLAETAEFPVETRVSRSDVQSFIAANAGSYDLLVVGSSRDRSAASRFVSPPTFERLQEVDCDVAVFDRGDL